MPEHGKTGLLALATIFLLFMARYPAPEIGSFRQATGAPAALSSAASAALSSAASPLGSATSGTVFSGARVREASPALKRTLNASPLLPDAAALHALKPAVHPSCRCWSVATTIFSPTRAMEKVLNGSGWCLIVAGDRSTPHEDYYQFAQRFQGRIVYLDVVAQERMQKHIELLRKLPWRHFGRKNAGYAMAVLLGAEAVWDFDDDNVPLGSLPSCSGLPSALATRSHAMPPARAAGTFNPYPVMGATDYGAWPRGLPLAHVTRDSSRTISDQNARLDEGAAIGVVQSLAQDDPDVDAIYRLTRGVPLRFREETAPMDSLVVLPSSRVAPFNAQATLWLPAAYWGMLLPTTVHGRVSDIWRSYHFAAVAKALKIHLAFSPPLVSQKRNPHSYMADFQAELQLYEQAEALTQLVGRWEPPKKASTFELMLEFAVEMYERGYWGEEDVVAMRCWTTFLNAAGHNPPALGRQVSSHGGLTSEAQHNSIGNVTNNAIAGGEPTPPEFLPQTPVATTTGLTLLSAAVGQPVARSPPPLLTA
jgi:hypothetical protein|eukprot:COSAG01_NODE_274_length_19734_cov_122.033512_17_plen_536_part_00